MKRIIVIILAAFLCLAAGVVTYEAVGRIQRNRIYGKLKESAPYSGRKDFEYLRSIDPNIFAWLYIPGTDVEYPIVKHPDDDTYYLTHTVEGYKGYPGSIFTYGYTDETFSQFNTIVYGHDLIFGGMFSELDSYSDPAFFEEHRTVRIMTPDASYTYEVAAFVNYDDRLIDTWYDQRDPADRKAFINSLTPVCGSLDGIDVLNDHLLTLETCRGKDRILVIAVRNEKA